MGTLAITSDGGGATAGVDVLDGTTAVTDVDAVATFDKTFSIVGGTHAALFSINASTGALAFLSAAQPGTYQVTVRAEDDDSGDYTDKTFDVVVTATVAGGDFFAGVGMGSSLLSNVRIVSGGTGSNAADECCIGFIAQGARIDAVRQFIIYTSGDSGYSTGNGGTIKVEIRAHDAVNNRPSDTVLAETVEHIANTRYQTQAAAESAYAGAVWSHGGESGIQLYHFKRMNLTSPLTVTPGTKYWLCTKQVRGGTGNTVSVDHLRNRHQFIRRLIDPDFDDSIEYRVMMRQGSTWVDKSASAAFGYVAIAEIIGDVNHGQAAYGVPSSADLPGESDLVRNVNGTKRVRQMWTFAADSTLTSLSIAAGINSGSAPLYCAIKQGGSTLHTASFSGYPALTQSGKSVVTIHNEIGWATAALPDISVTGGSAVTFEVYTTAGTDYEVPCIKDGQGYYFTSGGFSEGEFSYTNDGVSWTVAGNTDMAFAVIAEAA